MLDCWPVNLSAITKRHVLDKCPGMALIFLLVVLGVIKLTIQTSTNHAFKDCIRFEACAWYRSMLKRLQADRVTGKLTEENFIVAVSKLVNIGTLRNKVPEWANQALKQLIKPGIDRPDCLTMIAPVCRRPGVSRCCHYSHNSV